MGHGFSFDVELRRGAGAYICGEETAIFESIEGKRGEPRAKPPFPVEVGLFGAPTVVNNVETLVNVLDIVLGSGPSFAESGTEGSTGTKLLCVSGHVERPGTYEVGFGATLREVLELAGGVPGGRALQAVLLGGAAGSFVGPDDLDVPLTFEGARDAGTTLGSGVVLVLDETVDLPRLLMRIAAFFRNESCGQCVPCRVGTVRQQEALARLLADEPRGGVERELALIGEVGQCMRDASICGLGQTASSAIESAIRRLHVFQGARRERAPRAAADGRARGRRAGRPRLRGLDDPRRVRDARDRDADALLRRDAPARERLPRLRRRGRGLARPAPGLRAEGRGGDGGADGHRARPSLPEARARAARLVGRPLDDARGARVPRRGTGAEPERFGPPAPPTDDRDRARTGHHVEPDGRTAATVHQPVKVDNELYVRDYGKCILCYKCVDACGEQYQNTFAIHVAGRGFDARISTELATPLPESACVYCGNCIAVCPTGALMFRSEHELREAGEWREDEQTVTETICPVLRRRLLARAARPGQPDRQGDEPRRPRRHPREPLHQGPLRLRARAGRWDA